MAIIDGTGRPDHLIGTPQADTISGLGGMDILEGRGGADVINGGGGNDIIEGEGGNDTLFGDNGSDAIGGGDGSDTVEGGAGGDFLRGMGGIDTLSYVSSVAGVIIFFGVNNIATASGGHATGDSGDGFENITGSDFDDFLFANNVANVLTGGDGDDQLFGLGGADTLLGGFGNDFLEGGTGADILNGSSHTLAAETGGDFISYASSPSGVTVDLGNSGTRPLGKADTPKATESRTSKASLAANSTMG